MRGLRHYGIQLVHYSQFSQTEGRTRFEGIETSNPFSIALIISFKPKVGPDLRGLRPRTSMIAEQTSSVTEGRTRFEGIETLSFVAKKLFILLKPKVGPDLRGLRPNLLD